MIKTKLFTLIELLITIVVIGVLAAIVIPNINGIKEEGTTAAMKTNIKNIETALTMYSLENHGALPILGEPEVGLPEPLLLDQLYPDFLRSKPDVKGMNYWVDYTEKVWASSADSPLSIVYTTDGKLKWEKADNAETYNVFKSEDSKVTSKATNKKVLFVENTNKTEVILPKLEDGEFYLVNSVDNFGLESPPVNSEYQGNLLGSELPENGLSQKEKFPWLMNMDAAKWTKNESTMTDGDDATFHTLSSNEDYLFDWEGDMSNRVFQVTYSTANISSTTKLFNFLDVNGDNIPFINANTDQKYTVYSVGHNLSKRTVNFVVPRGAAQLKIHGTATMNLYKANFVDDLSLPYPVQNVKSETTKDSMTLKWNPPTNAENFAKVAIYEGEKFLGYSSNGEFTINSLYADTEYIYSIEPISVVGNRGPRVEHFNKTFRPEIVWSGLDNANAFDSSLSTYSTAVSDSVIRWEGDLANRQISLRYEVSSGTTSYYRLFSFYDDAGNVIESKMANNNQTMTTFRMTGSHYTRNFQVIVPEGATHIKFGSGNLSVYVYDVSYGTTLALPSKLTGVTATSTTETITLAFNRPSDVTRVAVFRDGTFLDYSSTETYTDTSLYAGKEYTYSFETYNSSGHRTSEMATISYKTDRPAIVWSGLDNANAFDSSLSTYSTAVSDSVIRWDGDLANRQISLRYEVSSGTTSYYRLFSFYDDAGNVIESKMANNNQTMTTFRMTGSHSIRNFQVIVPEGATHIKFGSGNLSVYVYDVSYGTTLALPSKLSGVTATSTTESITLTFNRPADVTRVAVFRDGAFLDYSSTETYTDTSLYSDKEYTYSFETYNSSGHRTSEMATITQKTLRSAIVWSGLDNANAFDSSLSTYSTATTNSVIRWDGDLANRQITLRYETSSGSSSYYRTLSFYDDAGNVIATKMANNNQTMTTFKFTGSHYTRNFQVIVPEGATHIKFGSGNLSVYVYDVSYGTTLAHPSELSGVTATSTTESITLTFNRPADVTRVAVFRDGTFVDYSSTETYTDTSLYSDKEYTYSFETYNSSGHRTSEMATITHKTLRSEIVWSGLDNANAFDSSLTTYSTATTSSVIRWDGDLVNKQVDLRYETSSGSSSYYRTLSFYDDAGNVIATRTASSDQVMTTFKVTGSHYTRTFQLIVPEGATHIKFGSGNLNVRLYDVKHIQ